MTHDGHQSADDLLQEAFIQFTIAKPDLAAINNLDAYLTTLIRNVHVSQARRAARRKFEISIEEYDSADVALTLTDGEQRLRLLGSRPRQPFSGCLVPFIEMGPPAIPITLS